MQINVLRTTILILLLGICACKKSQLAPPPPTSAFNVKIFEPFIIGGWQQSTTTLVDSNFYFQNLSEQGSDISYLWSFGDGETSVLPHPKHKYTHSGYYKVNLTTSRSNKISTTADTTLRVIIGERSFLPFTGQSTSSNGNDLLVRKNGGYIILGHTISWPGGSQTWQSFLLQVDDELNTQSLKAYPQFTRLRAGGLNSDGNILAIGTAAKLPSTHPLLIKFNPQGELVWSRQINADDDYVDVQQTADGGYILTGMRPIKDQGGNLLPKTLVVKTNSNGEKQWERHFAQDFVLANAGSLVQEPDGFVLVANKPSDLGGCKCDSAALVKLTLNGEVAWKQVSKWPVGVENPGRIQIAKIPNGNYQVVSTNTDGLFIYSPTGQYLSRELTPSHNYYTTSSPEGQLVLMGVEVGNGFRATISSYSQTGTLQWSYKVNRNYRSEKSWGCCLDSWPVVIRPQLTSGTIALVELNNMPTLIKLDPNGRLW